jgi:hypothetical protein
MRFFQEVVGATAGQVPLLGVNYIYDDAIAAPFLPVAG